MLYSYSTSFVSSHDGSQLFCTISYASINPKRTPATTIVVVCIPHSDVPELVMARYIFLWSKVTLVLQLTWNCTSLTLCGWVGQTFWQRMIINGTLDFICNQSGVYYQQALVRYLVSHALIQILYIRARNHFTASASMIRSHISPSSYWQSHSEAVARPRSETTCYVC